MISDFFKNNTTQAKDKYALLLTVLLFISVQLAIVTGITVYACFSGSMYVHLFITHFCIGVIKIANSVVFINKIAYFQRMKFNIIHPKCNYSFIF